MAGPLAPNISTAPTAAHDSLPPSALLPTDTNTGAQLYVKVKTRSSHPGIGPKVGDEWIVRVSAIPSEGAANQAVTALLAAALSVPPSRITLIAGGKSTSKRFYVEGLSSKEIVGLLTHAEKNKS